MVESGRTVKSHNSIGDVAHGGTITMGKKEFQVLVNQAVQRIL